MQAISWFSLPNALLYEKKKKNIAPKCKIYLCTLTIKIISDKNKSRYNLVPACMFERQLHVKEQDTFQSGRLRWRQLELVVLSAPILKGSDEFFLYIITKMHRAGEL